MHLPGTSPTRVDPPATREQWDAFVDAAPDATFFHRAAWMQLLEHVFGFRAHPLTAWRDGRIVGVLPLCEVRPPFGKPRLLSLPFAVTAGVSAVDDAARHALEDAAVARAGAIGARYLELRDGLGGNAFQLTSDLHCRFRRRLAPDDAENLLRIPRKQRRMIRIGQHSDLRASVDAQVDVFYDLYARSQRRLGTPVLPRGYFVELLRQCAADTVILTVRRGAVAVASVLSFRFRDTILPYYAGSREEYFRYAINDFMYWELMRFAGTRGVTMFDFGRSRRGSGAFDYKRHWGFEPEPLRYRVHSLGQPVPRKHTVDDPRVRLLAWGWRRLPLGVTTRLGPLFVRHFGPYFT